MAHKPKTDQNLAPSKNYSGGNFAPGTNSPSDWAREQFKPSEDSWRYV